MSTAQERYIGHTTAVLSAGLHVAAPVAGLWQIIQGTRQHNFAQLQWRYQRGSTLDGEQVTPEEAIRRLGPNYVTIPGHKGAKRNRIGTYAGAVISISELDAGDIIESDRKLAVSYRDSNDDIMVGTNGRATRQMNFIRRLQDDSERFGVIVGIGPEDNTTAIGHVDLRGHDFIALPTLYAPDADQSNLLRV